MPVRLRLSLLALLAIAFYQWSNGGGGGVRAALTVRNSSLASDTKMLLAFKAGVTADPYQRLASTWVQAGSPCGGGWYGVQCNSGGRVAVLKLESLGLQGALSPALGDLPYLVYLNLSWNLLSSAIPSALARLPLLKYLDLSNNLLSQALPPPSLPSLAHLFLHSNQLSGPLPPAIANSPALSILSLSNNNLSGPAPLAALSRLTKLRSAYLAYNSLSGPIPPDIRSLASLEILDLTGNFFYGSLPKEFGLLSNLEVLNLGGNDLNGTLPPQLGNCSRLSELRLNSNAFSGGIPTALCSKGTLTVLDLHDNLLNYSIPSSIGSCTRLRELNLRKNYLQNSIPAAIGTLQSLYTALDLSHNDLQGEIPPQIGDLDLISYVDLSYNMLTAEVPPSFGNCGRLTWLDLSNNNLTGSIPATFGNLDNLDHLDMSNNHLSGSIPSELGQLLSLQMLDLSFNKLSGELPSELENLNLSQLNLSYNMLVGPIPSSFLNFSSSAFQNNSALCGWAAENTCSPESPTQASSKRGLNGGLLAVSCLVITVLLLIGLGALFYMSRHPGVGLSSSYDSQKVIRARAFSKDALSVATEGFSDKNLVGEGKRFRVFKGYIDGMIVAVKQVKEELFEALRTNFSTEMEILSKAQHPNLLKVLGWCSSPDMLAVVLPFVRNGSLEMHLHPTNGIPSGLSFDVRLRIALGIANGLAYLHQAWEVNPVLHCQLKAKSIHLDDNLFPQMSNYTSLNSPTDFALSGVLSGYMAPECKRGAGFSFKSDVYSYGVVLLELILGRRPEEDFLQQNITEWARQFLPDHVWDIVDPLVTATATCPEQALSVLEIAVFCTDDIPESRPSMPDVLELLNKALKSPTDAPIESGNIRDGLAYANQQPCDAYENDMQLGLQQETGISGEYHHGQMEETGMYGEYHQAGQRDSQMEHTSRSGNIPFNVDSPNHASPTWHTSYTPRYDDAEDRNDAVYVPYDRRTQPTPPPQPEVQRQGILYDSHMMYQPYEESYGGPAYMQEWTN